MKQIVAHKKLHPVHGMLLVLGLVLLLVLLNYLVIDYLALYLGGVAASLGFWVLGGLIAWCVLRVYIVNYVYELDENVLRLNRKYGKRQRHIEDIYLNNLLFVGSPAEAKKRWPQAKRLNVVHAGTKDPVTAVVYQNSGAPRIARIQANDDLKARLVACVKKK